MTDLMPRQNFFILTVIALGIITTGFFVMAKNYKTNLVPSLSPVSAVPKQQLLKYPDIPIKNTAIKKTAGPANAGKTLIINRVSTDKKIVALTFDADMTRGMEEELKNGKVNSWYNEEVIKTLEETETPATLFLTGLWIKNYPAITGQLAANPLFEIANHSYSHPGFAAPCYKLPVISENLDESEIIRTENLLKEYVPNYKKYFRFPGLCYDDFAVAAAKKLGYEIIGGDIKGLDGFTNDASGIISRVVSRVKPGSIVILHMHGGPNAPETGKALPEIIRQLKEKGYKFVKVSELLSAK